MGTKKIMLTQEAYDKLLEELQFLATKRRKEIALRFREAFEADGFPDGDTMDEEVFVENRISQINNILNLAIVIEHGNIEGDKIEIGSQVALKDLESQEVIEFILASSAEANLSNQRLSDESPVGKAIKGKRAGQVVKVKAPYGQIKYEIISVGNRVKSILPKVS